MFVCQLDERLQNLIRESAQQYSASEGVDVTQNVMEERLCNITDLEIDSEALSLVLYDVLSDMDYNDYLDTKEEDLSYLKNEIDTKGFYEVLKAYSEEVLA